MSVKPHIGPDRNQSRAIVASRSPAASTRTSRAATLKKGAEWPLL